MTSGRYAAFSQEAARLHALPDRWLASELMRLCRLVRSRTEAGRSWQGYNSRLLWDIVPELAYRLGGPREPNESADPLLRMMSGQELRNFVAVCIENVDRPSLVAAHREERLSPVDVLFREVGNGNPIAMALDRISPPDAASEDFCARHVREISRARGLDVVSAWYPDLDADPSPKLSFG